MADDAPHSSSFIAKPPKLYRGLFANYLKVIPAVSISFVVFEATKTELERTFGKR